jgi:hypothetical protein
LGDIREAVIVETKLFERPDGGKPAKFAGLRSEPKHLSPDPTRISPFFRLFARFS